MSYRLIKVARELPLTEQKSLFESELGESFFLETVRANQQNANRYTKEFARLDCRFDQSEIKVDEVRPQISTRFKQLFNEDLKMAKSSVTNPILPFKSFTANQKQVCIFFNVITSNQLLRPQSINWLCRTFWRR
jgi:hypothetical protein